MAPVSSANGALLFISSYQHQQDEYNYYTNISSLTMEHQQTEREDLAAHQTPHQEDTNVPSDDEEEDDKYIHRCPFPECCHPRPSPRQQPIQWLLPHCEKTSQWRQETLQNTSHHIENKNTRKTVYQAAPSTTTPLESHPRLQCSGISNLPSVAQASSDNRLSPPQYTQAEATNRTSYYVERSPVEGGNSDRQYHRPATTKQKENIPSVPHTQQSQPQLLDSEAPTIPVSDIFRQRTVDFIVDHLSGGSPSSSHHQHGAARGNSAAVTRLYRTAHKLETTVYAAARTKESYIKGLACKLAAVSHELHH